MKPLFGQRKKIFMIKRALFTPLLTLSLSLPLRAAELEPTRIKTLRELCTNLIVSRRIDCTSLPDHIQSDVIAPREKDFFPAYVAAYTTRQNVRRRYTEEILTSWTESPLKCSINLSLEEYLTEQMPEESQALLRNAIEPKVSCLEQCFYNFSKTCYTANHGSTRFNCLHCTVLGVTAILFATGEGAAITLCCCSSSLSLGSSLAIFWSGLGCGSCPLTFFYCPKIYKPCIKPCMRCYETAVRKNNVIPRPIVMEEFLADAPASNEEVVTFFPDKPTEIVMITSDDEDDIES